MTKRSTLGGSALLALALLFIGLTILFGHLLANGVAVVPSDDDRIVLAGRRD